MSTPKKGLNPDAAHEEEFSKVSLGFWVYLMTDCVLFASLFATYLILHNNTNGGAGSDELFKLPYVLIETLLLLTSSFTSGLAMLAAHRNNKNMVIFWLIITAALGLAFLGMEVTEFASLAHEGNSWAQSGFLTGYFALVGTHGLHIAVGLLWLTVLAVLVFKRGIINSNVRRLSLFSMFWHFLDIVWIFIFSVVYLIGAL